MPSEHAGWDCLSTLLHLQVMLRPSSCTAGLISMLSPTPGCGLSIKMRAKVGQRSVLGSILAQTDLVWFSQLNFPFRCWRVSTESELEQTSQKLGRGLVWSLWLLASGIVSGSTCKQGWKTEDPGPCCVSEAGYLQQFVLFDTMVFGSQQTLGTRRRLSLVLPDPLLTSLAPTTYFPVAGLFALSAAGVRPSSLPTPCVQASW